ncbi:hypothetical protein BUALT_Bualt19G0061500 [Buddleja alternifolia]|uniref:Uncharacterized protein n=1 Tax=Buddleja alternifolia TaxID=168488 RepID=A0AAV6W5E5_9LAMI|nr:hypothetical protein BUALT_Bualt19G0061500 [Buddleja alternifolia]
MPSRFNVGMVAGVFPATVLVLYLRMVGDSSSDTGNYIRESANGAASAFARLPYGQTFFKKPTGRCSNGLLIIDYIAIASGLAFIDPNRKTLVKVDFKNGDNFATAGATALPDFVLKPKNISLPLTSTSLDVQLDFMFTHFNSICRIDCIELLKNSLFMVGDIGANDYSFALLQGKTIKETTSLIPDVVYEVQKTIRRVIEYGAVGIVVPGIFPLGCLPNHLTKFGTNNAAAYDQYQCLKYLNDLSITHNQQLQRAIEEVKKENPKVTIVYGDFYNAYMALLRNAQRLRFDVKNLQKACCGIGGKYNFDFKRTCGSHGVPVCADPNRYISWDGINLTQQAYRIISQLLVRQILPELNCNA